MERVHGSVVSVGGKGVLLVGESGSGKSDLALRLIDRGAALVADDYAEIMVSDGTAYCSPPSTIAGRIEVRGIGILVLPYVADVPLALVVDLDKSPTRLPVPAIRNIGGAEIPLIMLRAFEASAAIKVELALNAQFVPLD